MYVWSSRVVEAPAALEVGVSKRCLKDANTEGSISVLEEVGSKARVRRIEGSMAGTRASSFASKK